MVAWTDEKIAALSTPELKNLLANAERKSVDELVERCTIELTTRNAANPRAGGKARNPVKEFEREMAEQIAAVGREVAEKYDLSEATAKAASVGVKGFKAHRLLDAKGYAKLGGMQRDGSVAIDRYISYRRGNDTAALGVFLLKEQPVESREFHVIAPLALLDGAKPIADIRPTATATQRQSADGGLAFDNLDEAAIAFDAVLAKIAG